MKNSFARFAADYGMFFVLLLLCAYYSWATYSEQQSGGVDGAEQIAAMLQSGETVFVAGRDEAEDRLFVDVLKSRIPTVVESVNGQPGDALNAIRQLAEKGTKLNAIVVTPAVAEWPVFENLEKKFPGLGKPRILTPRAYYWPNFLKSSNLLNVANQIAVIAIIAIGMTIVILTAGIDLSVGSLVALSAVSATLLIRSHGAEHASALTMTVCCVVAIALTGGIGTVSGALITTFGLPPFIVTLAVMLIASGFASNVSGSESIYQLPDSFVWLGRTTILGGVPLAVVLMLTLYAIAHIMMSRTIFGRYVYAVGGNGEAARLSGVPVRIMIVLAYTLSGLMAGLGGVIMASMLKSGVHTFGNMYELYVIAAVVVGGTSLSGGEGKVLGTLIGALIIAVIQNGMNLTGVESTKQKIVLGFVILGAVLLDKLKKRLSGA
jgi:ribose transport system permease protein